MKGTMYRVNEALSKPILFGGVEKRLMFINAIFSFDIVLSAHFHAQALFGIVFFMVVHFLLRMVSKHDPMLGTLFRRGTRYMRNAYFPATSHALHLDVTPVKSVAGV